MYFGKNKEYIEVWDEEEERARREKCCEFVRKNGKESGDIDLMLRDE